MSDPSAKALEDISHIKSFLIVVGLSGAGKSTANKALSDEGFFSIDNLPITLLPNFLALSRSIPERYLQTSVLLDIATTEEREQFFRFLGNLPPESTTWQVIFLDASVETLLRRYSETRRPHPTFRECHSTVRDAIEWERQLLQPVKERANIIIDTSRLSPHDLRRSIQRTVRDFFCHTIEARTNAREMQVHLQSFGFKYGAPIDCDLIIDVRFLPNPHFVDELRPQTGLDPDVSKYVLNNDEAESFLKKFQELLEFLLPRYTLEGKSYLNIGIGCTGGQHRSVAIASELGSRLALLPYAVSVAHRDCK